MDKYESLSHTAWDCKYHVIFIPKCRRRTLYGQLRQHLGARHSPAHTVALVELYTSEGCSSCPPADRWLASLAEQQAAGRLVSLALHVDYWDYIGWRDPLAQSGFTARQRQLAKGGTIYTPEVFMGQRELRRWYDAGRFQSRLDEINRQPARADIGLAVEVETTRAATARARARIVAEARFYPACNAADVCGDGRACRV